MSGALVFFDVPFRLSGHERAHAPFPPVNIYENAAAVRILALAPGADEGNVRVSMDKDVLCIAGEIPQTGLGISHRRERFCGCFCRRVKLLVPFGAQSLSWTVRNGIVDVYLRKPMKRASHAKPGCRE